MASSAIGPDYGAFYLARMKAFVARRRRVVGVKSADLIDRAMVSTYLACVDHGTGEEAKHLLGTLVTVRRLREGDG